MTTQEKTSAIQDIVRNHQDNVAAKDAANVGQGLDPLAIEAMNNAFKADLEKIFALKPVKARTAKRVRR